MFRTLGRHGSVPQPGYSPITATRHTGEQSTHEVENTSDLGGGNLDRVLLHSVQRHSQKDASPSPKTSRLPSLTRFLADFTLGFADGLTVPFALTAGLSSLGQTDTVIYAGMAELCAGSISMGIGGYLSARGERRAEEEADDDEEEQSLKGPEKPPGSAARYLEPLRLPPGLLELVVAHLNRDPTALASVESKMAGHDKLPSPVLSGLSVAVGYLSGGMLPLFPYLVVGKVGDGLLWSSVVCIVALFVFGFTKDFVLHAASPPREDVWLGGHNSARSWWKRLRRGVWEGVQMVLLGSLAAIAALLCVSMFEGMRVARENPKL